MASEKFKNAGSTTLSAGVNNTSDPVTLTVASATNFPTAGNFRILIDSEILLVTSVSGTSFTASRAQEGTSIASHSNGSAVALVLTAASLIQAIQDVNISSLWGSRITTDRQSGRLFFPTDSFQFSRDTGSAWESWGLIDKQYDPSGLSFSWDNQGTGTVDVTDEGILLVKPDYNTGNPAIRYKTAPSAPYTCDIKFDFNYNPVATQAGVMFGWRDSSNGKLALLKLLHGDNSFGGIYIENGKWTNSTTFSTTYNSSVSSNNVFTRLPTWVRLKNDNTNAIVQLSHDGICWYQWHTIGKTDFMTRDQLCFGIIKGTNNTGQVSMKVHSWREY
jgi:hypothetical protein